MPQHIFTLVCILLTLPALPSTPQLRLAATTIEIAGGARIRVDAGELVVPESREHDNGRRLRLPFQRLKSTAQRPATAIFLLAGGPGASWLDRLRDSGASRKEVLFYQGIADVVLFDQRGGGRSLPAMDCAQTVDSPSDQPLDPASLWRKARRALAACRDHWLAQGVDLTAYNTLENAADVDALRAALGYERISVVGGSYGSHLALQLMRQFPERIERAVLHGVEGPDHSWDNPDGRLAALARIAEAAELRPELAGRVPRGGLLAALRRVIATLDEQPQTVLVEGGGKRRSVVVDAHLLRLIAAHQAGSGDDPLAWPELLLALERGDFSMAARGALAYRQMPLDDPMHYSMDCASGISAQRRLRYQQAAARSLLGDINAEYAHLCDLWPHRDLGADFRAAVVSDIPTLLVHGSFDVSTPLENAREVAATLRYGQVLEVQGGHHGALYQLFEHWPPMRPTLRDFLRGRKAVFPHQVRLPQAR